MMRRREFISLVAGLAGWPLAVDAQQPGPTMVGFLTISGAQVPALWVAAFKQGLQDAGFVEGQNVATELRSTANQFNRLPALAADLVGRRPAAVLAVGPPSVRALKAHTATIPIVFVMGEDPVKEGLVASLNRPGGNITGISFFTNQLFAKRLQLLNEVVPKPARLALLVNPDNPNAGPDSEEARAAARALGRELIVLTANTGAGIDEAFSILVARQIGGLMVGVDGLFLERLDQIFALAARHAIPAIYDRRDYTVAGGLMSYGTNYGETFHQAGVYVGRILKGEKPANLPVLQSTKFEFVINLRIAKVLGLAIPPGVLAIADEIIE